MIAAKKQNLRDLLRAKRRTIPPERRTQAAGAAEKFLRDFNSLFNNVLSFVSFDSEIDTTSLNRRLAQQGRLLLPRMEGGDLHLYHITDLDRELEQNRIGIFEPKAVQSNQAALQEVSLALVPGIAFDVKGHRLGYGKGYYDHLLDRLNAHAPCYGLGFSEQLTSRALPIQKHDIPLQGVLLF